MKNINTIFNVVLLTAVIVLFYFQFSGTKAVKTVGANNAKTNFSIAYFEEDSIQNNFEYFKMIKAELDKISQQKASDLNNDRAANANKLREYQEKGQAMTQAEQINAQADMENRQRNFAAKEQRYTQELQQEQLKRLQDVKKKIEDFLKEYNADKGYAYIFSATPEIMYYKDTVLNITPDVVKGLNAKYPKPKQ